MLSQSIEPYAILILLGIAMIFFIWNRWRYDVVALCTLAIAVLMGAVPFHMVYSGLNNNAVITVACVMIISNIITSSGVLNAPIEQLNKLSKSPFLHMTILCVITAVLSAFMNNIGALALMMPIAIKTSLDNKRSPSIILMPLALSSALGGMTTLIGTPANLLVANFRTKLTGQSFTMFDYSHAGICIAVIGILFIIFIGWRLLPKRMSSAAAMDLFDIDDYITELQIPKHSKLNDIMIEDFENMIEAPYELLGIIRKHNKIFHINPQLQLKNNDILIIKASSATIELLVKKTKCTIYGGHDAATSDLRSDEMTMLEVVVPPGSRLEGRTWQGARIRSQFQANLICISRKGKPFRTRLNHSELKAGDVLLLQLPMTLMDKTVQHIGLLPLAERNINIKKPSLRTLLPLLIFIVAIILAASGLLPVAVAFGGAILVMVLTRTVPLRNLYDNIEWPIIILLMAMIPVGNALVSTGGSAKIVGLLTSLSQVIHPIGMLALVLIVTMTLSDFMNNAVTAIIMAPIAAKIAMALHVSSNPFLMAVAIGASCSFLTPIGHQNNTLVMGPGGYKFTDYIRLGLPLEIIIVLVAVPLLLWAWPL